MSKLPTAKAIREAKLNITEALAHLNVVGKALRQKNPVKDMADIRTKLVRKIVFSRGSNSDQCADFLKINLKKVSDNKIKKILADIDSRTGRNKYLDKYDIGEINKKLLDSRSGNRRSNPVQHEASKIKTAKRVYAGFRLSHSKSVREYRINANNYENSHKSMIGKMSAIEYSTVRAGKTERYRHEFKSGAAPEIYSINKHGSRLGYMIRSIGGRFKFGNRGFVDRAGKKENTDFPDYSVLVEIGTLDAYELWSALGVRFEIPAKSRPILAVTESGDAIYTLKR